jgi:cytochrome c-type biogenesis protein
MTENLNILLVFGAGIASVFSPCVIPVIPIVITGSGNEHKLRPLAIVAGLMLTFVVMGIISTMFGAFLGAYMKYMAQIAGVLIIISGLLLFFNFNPFKYLHISAVLAGKTGGLLGGFVLGLTLGIIWIPCVGPILSAVLALVATDGRLLNGILLLFVYALGFAVPMLIAGYASHFFRNKFRKIGKFPYIINVASGLLLIVLGIIIFTGKMI